MKNLEEIYNEKCADIYSDICEHLPTLKRYAEECEHITEMGVRWVVSTYALMMGKPKKLISIDIDSIEKYGTKISDLVELGNSVGIDFNFIISDTRQIEIEETDLLFIDTLHNYNQLKSELELHGNKAKKYLIFHDTTLFEFRDERHENAETPGLWPALEEFLQKNQQWEILERYTNNCGLTVLKRK
jgi:cephalosporin hydroxylase